MSYDLNSFSESSERASYDSLEAVYDAAGLQSHEREVFTRYEKFVSYWLLRAKLAHVQSWNDHPNFIQSLARVLIKLGADEVSGSKVGLIKEMFGAKTVSRCYKTKNGVRSTSNSNNVGNIYLELLIMSFFLDQEFQINLSKSNKSGEKIAEFSAQKAGVTIHVESKNLDVNKILDHIYGDVFFEDFGRSLTDSDRQIGYQKIRSIFQSNYENALRKHACVPEDEYFLLFVSYNLPLSLMGSNTTKYLADLPLSWGEEEYRNFIGVVCCENKKTTFLKNASCSIALLDHVENIADFYKYIP